MSKKESSSPDSGATFLDYRKENKMSSNKYYVALSLNFDEQGKATDSKQVWGIQESYENVFNLLKRDYEITARRIKAKVEIGIKLGGLVLFYKNDNGSRTLISLGKVAEFATIDKERQ
jgi:hypothetical protein